VDDYEWGCLDGHPVGRNDMGNDQAREARRFFGSLWPHPNREGEISSSQVYPVHPDSWPTRERPVFDYGGRE
jgi:hypothetical protein